jgi:hypothetical protein
MQAFNGLGLNLGNLSRLSNAESRSLSAENPTGAKGQGGRHVDPNHGPFKQDLGVTMQALGWRAGWHYLPLQHDIASTAFWYQTEPHAPFPKLPDRDGLEII